MGLNSEKPEIAFFDVETTIPIRPGQGYAILEFGAMLVCSQKLIELESYSTLIRPADLSLISTRSVSCNGITKDDVVSAPSFADVADKVYDLLHGRIWAGHNILRFDCARIREAFAEINRPAPLPKATIDSLALLTQRFGRRAGDMKMASLATYFGLGQQTHRSLDDVRMNLEVLKYCATVLLLESSLPDIFTENCWVSPGLTKISRNNGSPSSERTRSNSNKPSSSAGAENLVTPTQFNSINVEIHTMESLVTGSRSVPNSVGYTDMGLHHREVERDHLPSDDSVEEEEVVVSGTTSRESSNANNDDTHDLVGHNNATTNAFDMDLLRQEVETIYLPSDDNIDKEVEEPSRSTSRETSNAIVSEMGSINSSDFLEPDKISLPSISVIFAPYYRGTQKMHVLHEGVALQICCKRLRVRFGVSTRFFDAAGRARLSFVVDASPILCEILDTVDGLARMLSVDSNTSSEWRPLVSRKPGFINSPTIRLHLPTMADGNMGTEMYIKESSATRRLVLSISDVTEIDSLLTPGRFVDAYFSLDSYDYQQNAGIRLVAKKLIIHSC